MLGAELLILDSFYISILVRSEFFDLILQQIVLLALFLRCLSEQAKITLGISLVLDLLSDLDHRFL